MRWSLALLIAACGGSSSSPTRTAAPSVAAPQASTATPLLLGKPVWDGPLTDPMANTLVERVNAVVVEGPPALGGADPRSWQGPVQVWIERRVKAGKEIRADVEALTSVDDPRMKLLSAVAFGVTMDDFVTDLLAIQMPAEALQGEFADETKKVFHEVLEEQAVHIASTGRKAMQRCIEVAPTAPASLRVWEAYCRERDAKLGELEARVAARGGGGRTPSKPPVKPPALFADCETKEVLHVSPSAPPPDRKAKPVVAYIYDGTDLSGDDARKLEQAVATKLGGDTGMPVVGDKELADARALVAQKKLHARAPVCGKAPPLPAVVAHKRKHLVVGEIQTTCISHVNPNKTRCGVLVEYVRAGGDDHTGLPEPMFAQVTSRDIAPSEWIAAVDKLAPGEGAAGLLGSLSMFDQKRPFFEVSGYADENAWLRVPWILHEDTVKEMMACIDGAASFDAAFTISRQGKTSGVSLKPVTAPPEGSKVTACVKQALEATAWPCTPDGKPAKVAVRMCVAPRPQ